MSLMKKITLAVILLALVIIGCGQAEPGSDNAGIIEKKAFPTPDWDLLPATFPDSMKGYELFSWETGSGWNFTLITGTNRNKTVEEITTAENRVEDGFVKVTVSGSEQLIKLLSRLPEGEDLLWRENYPEGNAPDNAPRFTYPPEDIIQQVAGFTAENGILFYGPAEQE